MLTFTSYFCRFPHEFTLFFILKSLKIFYWGVMESKNDQNHKNKTINKKYFKRSGWGWKAPECSKVSENRGKGQKAMTILSC